MLTSEKLKEIRKETHLSIVSSLLSDLGKAVDRCDPIAIEYALATSRSLERGLRKHIITINEYNKLEDDLKTTAEKLSRNCKFIKK